MSKHITIQELNEKINQLQNQIDNLYIKTDELHESKKMEKLHAEASQTALDEYKYRLTQKTPWGEIDHYFHEDREEQLIKLIRYCNEYNIEYELNDKAKEFHNKLYNMILKGE